LYHRPLTSRFLFSSLFSCRSREIGMMAPSFSFSLSKFLRFYCRALFFSIFLSFTPLGTKAPGQSASFLLPLSCQWLLSCLPVPCSAFFHIHCPSISNRRLRAPATIHCLFFPPSFQRVSKSMSTLSLLIQVGCKSIHPLSRTPPSGLKALSHNPLPFRPFSSLS